MKKTALFLAIFCSLLLVELANSAACGTTTLPTVNTALSTGGEFHTVSGALAGQLDPTSITCTTSGATANQWNYGQINLGYSTSSASAGNVCGRAYGAAQTSIQTQGSFAYDAAGAFVNAAGTTVNTGGGDTGQNTKVYYVGVQSIWIAAQDLASSPAAVSITGGLALYCYDAAYTSTYCSWLGTLTNAEATADVTATALDFLSAPTEAQTGCRFTITPSATSTDHDNLFVLIRFKVL